MIDRTADFALATRRLGLAHEGDVRVSVKQLRVYVASFGRLPCSLVRTLVDGARGIELIGQGSNASEDPPLPGILDDLDHDRPDLLILCVDKGDLDRYARLFKTRVLLVAPRERRLHWYPEREPTARETEFSRSNLVSMIRQGPTAARRRDANRDNDEESR